MKRKTLDILVGLGLVVLAGLLLVAGIVLTSNANFANNYVKDQLGQQQISFKPAAAVRSTVLTQPALTRPLLRPHRLVILLPKYR